MIQRIQTIYLLLAVIVMIALNWLPIAYIGDLEFLTYGIFSTMGDATLSITTYPIAVTVIVSTILAAIAIFMYKNRMKQVRVVAIAFLLSVIYAGFIFLWIIDSQATALAQQNITVSNIIYGTSSYFPIAQVIFLILAQQAIKKDEKLVRSSERLR